MNSPNNMKEFWNDRVKKYGHTGWKDDFIYAYDQKARLIAFEKIINSLNVKNTVALDFGAGSGDFAAILARYFKKVIAFDFSNAVIKVARQRYGKMKNIQFISSDNFEDVEISENTVDLILTVTVLGFVMNDSILKNTLRKFKTILKDSGSIIAFEYAVDHRMPGSHYQRFIKLKEWQSLFSEYGFYLHRYWGFYHPEEFPCQSYLSYRRSIKGIKGRILRYYGKYINRDQVNKYINRLAEDKIRVKNDFLWEGDQKQSQIKIMISLLSGTQNLNCL